jgi:hypothetical protein
MEQKFTYATRLSKKSHEDLAEMLKELLSIDADLKLNLSKLLSFLVSDFREKHFQKTKEKILMAHKDHRKEAKNTLDSLNEVQLESFMKVLEKVKKYDPLPAKLDPGP